jgi:putative nucleotidyltransferase with HDIG domain
MKEESQFLTGFAQVISAMSLYKEGHPARERAVDHAYDRLLRLQETHPKARFTFLGAEIIFEDRPVRDLRRWDWGSRLSRAGIQRLEFVGPVGRGDFEVFLDEAYDRLAGVGIDTAEVRQGRPTNIRYGSVGLDREEGGGAGERREVLTATLAFDLHDEFDTVDWLHEELRDRKELHLLEAEALVRSLSVAMHGDQAFLIPLLRLKRFDQYTTTHALNVSVLAMALSEFVGLSPREVRAFGIAGLLHDLGKVTVPDEILNKPGKLTDEERAVMNNHTVEGARIIMETEEHLDLAAVVAYEHHIRLNGGGYPTLTYPRPCHLASNMIHVCDVFDALRTHRPYREAWEQARVLGYLEEGAGTEFDGDLARAFVQMMNQWATRIATVTDPEEALPMGGTPDADGGGAE